MLSTIKERITEWRDYRFLKKHGCSSWYQYHRKTDPDVCQWASRLNDFYHGYPMKHCFENYDNEVYEWDLGRCGLTRCENWCRENLTGKWRFDMLRVYMQTPIGIYGVEESEYWINEIGGNDKIFFVCHDAEDMFKFKLRWGS